MSHVSGELQQRHLLAHCVRPAAASFGAQAGRHARGRGHGRWHVAGLAATRCSGGGGCGDRSRAAAQAAAIGGGEVTGGVAAQQPRGSRQDARLVVVRRQQAQQRALQRQTGVRPLCNMLVAVLLRMWLSVDAAWQQTHSSSQAKGGDGGSPGTRPSAAPPAGPAAGHRWPAAGCTCGRRAQPGCQIQDAPAAAAATAQSLNTSVAKSSHGTIHVVLTQPSGR